MVTQDKNESCYNATMAVPIDELMESASESLAVMDYLTCEAKCLAALGLSRAAGDWATYGRILLPLQECRRQRRMIAAEGTIRLGTAQLPLSPTDWVRQCEAGCIVLTHPHGEQDAAHMTELARQLFKHIEILRVNSACTDDVWQVVTSGPLAVSIEVTAPPAIWRDRDMDNASAGDTLAPSSTDSQTGASTSDPAAVAAGGHQTPGAWFIEVTEKLGDALLARVDAPLGGVDRIAQLEACLGVIADHEILHQRLWDATRALQAGTTHE